MPKHTYICRVTLEDEMEYESYEEATKATDEWAEGLADQEQCFVHHVEVLPGE